jgi:hypothetical protein
VTAALTTRLPRPVPTVRTDADLLESIRAHGLEVADVHYFVGGVIEHIVIRGVSFHLCRQTPASPWSLCRSGSGNRLHGDALPGDVWRAAQAHRAAARRLDCFLGVLDDAGIRVPEAIDWDPNDRGES